MAGLRRQVVAGITSRALNGATPDQLLSDVRASLERMVRREEALLARHPRPGPGRRAGIELCHWDDLGARRPRLPPRGVRPAHPPGGDPADRRSEPPVPLHLEPLAQHRGRGPQPHRRHLPLRPGQDPAQRRPAPAAARRRAVHPPRAGHGGLPRRAVPRHGGRRALRLPGHPGRRPGPRRRRRRRPPARPPGGAAPPPVPSRGAAGDRLADLRGVRSTASPRSSASDRDDVYRFAGPLGLDCLWAVYAPRPPRPPRRPWTPLVPPAFTSVEREEGAEHLQRPRPPGRARPPPLRLLLGLGRGVDERGGRGSPRPRHQAVPLPHLG